MNVEAIKNYKKTNINKLSDIKYIIEYAKFNKPLIIESFSNVRFDKCSFNKGLIVKNGKDIKFCNFSNFCTNIFFVNAEKLDVLNSNLIYIYEKNKPVNKVGLDARNIYIDNSYISALSSVEINAQNIYSSSLNGKTIEINVDRIFSKNNSFNASSQLIINDHNCDEIKGVKTQKMMYNGKDITNSDGIVIPKLRQQLIEKLRTIRLNIRTNISEETKQYHNSLEIVPIKTFTRK